jgi:hypothetical protein
MNNFQDCPFFVDEMEVRTIYRSLSPGNFFITFKHNNTTSKAIIIDTPYNSFNKYICSCSTVWNPDFDQMKALLILGVKVKETFTEDERAELLKSKEDLFIFGTYDFNEDCKYTVVDGKYTFKRKTYKFVIDNSNRIIKIVHALKDELRHILASISANDFFLLRMISVHHSFNIELLEKYKNILKWGSGVKTFYDGDEYYQSASMATYGLCFNHNINWTEKVVALAKFELNHFQATMYDDKAFPLCIEDEINAKTDVILSWSKAPDYYSENMAIDYYEKLANTVSEISEATSKHFDFLTLEDFIHFASTCRPVYSMNRHLYEIFLELLQAREINIFDILDNIKAVEDNGC